ncbi:4'-phosphopantetheinyl transferase superfamily protein [Microbispora sp. NPDC049125]|uniref:4'-phosphopantetheinyl transferase superfamily protein n=1 Tax=Microbispora sp. NPDC049125 TaxID=3154929 RepID=UPI003465258F
MISVRLGIDVTDAASWAVRLARTPDLGRTAFTSVELDESQGDPDRLSAVWAVKEAVVKALGTGFHDIGWRGVEVHCPHGRPVAVRLTTVLAPVPRQVRLALRGPRPGPGGSRPVVAAAAVGTGPARIATRIERIPGLMDGPRHGRAERASAAVRRAAEAAAADLLPGAAWSWSRTPGGAPALRTRDGRELAVALSHGSSVVAAAVADPEPAGGDPVEHIHRQSLILNVIDSDYLLAGVRAGD